MTNTDEILLAKAKTLDPTALQALHQRYYGDVARYIQFKVGDSKTVEDLTGEVFVRMMESLQRGYGWKNTPKSWIMGIARHVVADHYRQKGRMNEVELSDHIAASEECAPAHLALLNERKQTLWNAIQQLTDEQREVVILRFIAGVDIKSVAEIINKSQGAVKALQHRALRTLAKKVRVLKPDGK